MKIIAKKLSLPEFIDYVNKKDFGVLPPTFLVIHHTWKPKKDEWNGSTTIAALKKYYEGLGWSAGPHLFVAEDGIWLFTDMYDVGIHAGAGNGTVKTGYSIGIEVVGDYDNEVWSGKTKENALGVIKILQERLKLKERDLHFHREYSAKSCPGNAITMEWLLDQLHGKAQSEFDYKGNLYKIFGAVESLLGRADGPNPSDSETEAILEDLAEIKKRLDAPQIKTVTVEEVEKIVYKDSPELLAKIENQRIEIKNLLENKSIFYQKWVALKKAMTDFWNASE